MKLNLNSFILILPVALSWLAIGANPQLVLISLLVMAGAEGLRQYLSASFVRVPVAPRRLFFFGVIYKDSEGFFLNRKSSALFSGLTRSRKILLLIAVYILTLSLKFSSAFEDLNFIYSAFFSLIITLWVYCGTYRQLSRVLLLQIIGTGMAFLSMDEARSFSFLIWLAFAFWVQLQLHTWALEEESPLSQETSLILKSAGTVFKSAALVLVLIVCFRAADLLVPDYGEAKSSNIKTESTEETIAAVRTEDKKTIRFPKKLLSQLAKYKLQAGAIDFSRMNMKDIKVPSGEVSSPFKLPGFKLSFGEHRRPLEEIRSNLASDKPVRSEDLDKLRELTGKIRLPRSSGAAESEGGDFVSKSDAAAPDSTDQLIEERIERLKGQNQKMMPTEDDAEAYARARRELADEIDKLLEQDQKNTLAREELNLQKSFERFIVFLKRFSFLIALTVIGAWWLSRKSAVKNVEGLEGKEFSLPKEVRIQLKHLYKLLLKGKYSPKDEVIKSYHLVDLAFKEFEFARREDLPPAVFLEKLQSALPAISKSAEVPTELFCRVFYGDKTPAEADITQLRKSMHELMKKLRVV